MTIKRSVHCNFCDELISPIGDSDPDGVALFSSATNDNTIAERIFKHTISSDVHVCFECIGPLIEILTSCKQVYDAKDPQ